MTVAVERLTDWALVAECARTTVWKGALGHEPSDSFKASIILSEHSPLRALMFKVRMEGIPSFVSTHLVRHKYGVEHWVSSNRPDRNGGNAEINRNSPVTHLMVLNAQELLFMARRRLCSKASPETQQVMRMIRDEVRKIDPVLARHMTPMCMYRGRCCEPDGCGYFDGAAPPELQPDGPYQTYASKAPR